MDWFSFWSNGNALEWDNGNDCKFFFAYAETTGFNILNS